MKKFVMLVVASSLLGANAFAVGRDDNAAKIDCTKVIKQLEEQMKKMRSSGGEEIPAGSSEQGGSVRDSR